MTRRQWWRVTLLILATAAPGLVSGCGGSRAFGSGAGLQDVAALARSEGGLPDLERPVPAAAWATARGGREPLDLARVLAHTAGGAWVAVAPRPLQDVRLPQIRWPVAMTAGDALQILSATGAPVVWEKRAGYVVLYFGSEAEWHGLQGRAPGETSGLYLAGETGAEMLRPVSDLWGIRLHADPELLRLRAAVGAGQAPDPTDTEPRGALETLFSGPAPPADRRPTSGSRLELRTGERLDLPALMERLAGYFGGLARDTGGGTWELTRIQDPQRVAAEVDQLAQAARGELAESVGSMGSMGSGKTSHTSHTPLTSHTSHTSQPLEQLALLGRPAIPALAGFLDPARPEPALVAARLLGAMELPEAEDALAGLGARLQSLPAGEARSVRGPLMTELIRLLARRPGPKAQAWLGAVALDGGLSPETRSLARMALLRTGLTAPFENPSLPPAPPAEFNLTESPHAPAGAGAADPPAEAIRPLAVARPAGSADVWAVFVSPRFGNADDLWLARGRGDRWEEFLFTGRTYPRSGEYVDTDPPRPGCGILEVRGDTVTFRPPDDGSVQKEARLRRMMGDRSLPPREQESAAQEWYELREQRAGTLPRALSFSLEALRWDSDGDGLADLVETRLGLRPDQADTDGDGIPDGADMNPVARPAKNEDREKLLQALFAALYAGDPSPAPVLVMLEPGLWQEFHGARGQVLCVSREEYLRRAPGLGAVRLLQFGGPQDGASTLLRQDGPCLFSENGSRAEVHFWQWERRPARAYGWLQPSAGTRGASAGVPVDMVARFARQGGSWKLLSVQPWRWRTADLAAAELARQAAR